MGFAGSGVKHPEAAIFIGLPSDVEDIVQIHIHPVVNFQEHRF
jgi:hypothetical protein